MRALIVKEMRPFVAPGVVGMLLFAGLWIVVFDVESAFLAPPSRLMLATMFLGVHVGALLGWSQIQGERDATLSYLVHRAVTPARVLVAKCLAAYALLAMVVLAPAVLCALVERATSPLGPVLQWGRVGEIALAALVVVPAHALGTFVASLRASLVARLIFGAFALGGLGAAIGWALEHPVGDLATSRAAFALGCALVAAGLIAASAPGLARHEDADERPSLRSVGALLASLVAFVVVPGHFAATIAQGAVVAAARGDLAPNVLWSLERGVVVETKERISGIGTVSTLRDAEDEVVDAAGAGWAPLWLGGGGLGDALQPKRLDARDGSQPSDFGREGVVLNAPALAPSWFETVRYDAESRHVTLYHDRANGRFLVLAVPDVPLGPDGPIRTGTEPPPTLRAIVRGDGRRFSTDVQVEAFNDEVHAHDPSDGTAWKLSLRRAEGSMRTDLAFVHGGDAQLKTWSWSRDELRFGRYWPIWGRPDASEGEMAAVLRTDVEGDLLASTVRIVDAQSGEVLLTHDDAIAGWPGRGAAAFLIASELLRAPLLVAAGHVLQHPLDAWSTEPTLTGWATGARRRPWLALANVALAALLALRARRTLARANAEPRRQCLWAAAILLAGFPAWLAFLLAEPAAPAAARPALASRPLLLRSREATA